MPTQKSLSCQGIARRVTPDVPTRRSKMSLNETVNIGKEKRQWCNYHPLFFSVPAIIEVVLLLSMQKQNPISQIEK
jgi:hypothetical protein